VNSRGNMLFTCRWMLNKMKPKVLIFICHGTNEFSLPPFFHLCFDYALGKLNNVTSNISHFARIWGEYSVSMEGTILQQPIGMQRFSPHLQQFKYKF
jgi:hypothetical protein